MSLRAERTPCFEDAEREWSDRCEGWGAARGEASERDRIAELRPTSARLNVVRNDSVTARTTPFVVWYQRGGERRDFFSDVVIFSRALETAFTYVRCSVKV